MEIHFHKMHGTLNDFVVFGDLEGKVGLTPDQVSRICDRRAGVGADGVIAVRRSEKADFFMDYVNADGSLAEMCGNGIRCLAKYAYDNGLTKKTSLNVETRAGMKTLELFIGQEGNVHRVRVDMGSPIFDPEKIPVAIKGSAGPVIDYPLEAGGRTFLASMVSIGNPHCVILEQDDLDSLPGQYGPLIETHPLFPAKTNVEFVKVLSRSRLLMRVWERGSGETLSCGTGACATAVIANVKELVQETVTVEVRGGDLEISWKGAAFSALMTGPATLVYIGSITV